MDFGLIEDQELLKQVEKMRFDMPAQRKPKGGKLTSMKDETQRLAEENSDLKEQGERAARQLEQVGLSSECSLRPAVDRRGAGMY
jgi:hypothetical protein